MADDISDSTVGNWVGPLRVWRWRMRSGELLGGRTSASAGVEMAKIMEIDQSAPMQPFATFIMNWHHQASGKLKIVDMIAR